MVPKRGLGRGLGALLASSPTEGEALIEVSLDEVKPNPNQPRKSFGPAGLEELAASIRASGVLQPVIVRKTSHGYELIAGERRWRAARQAGLERIPVIVRGDRRRKLGAGARREPPEGGSQPHRGGRGLQQTPGAVQLDSGGAVSENRQGPKLDCE